MTLLSVRIFSPILSVDILAVTEKIFIEFVRVVCWMYVRIVIPRVQLFKFWGKYTIFMIVGMLILTIFN